MDTLADTNLATASRGAGLLAKEAAAGKVAKYQATARAMHAVHLPFAVETVYLYGVIQLAKKSSNDKRE